MTYARNLVDRAGGQTQPNTYSISIESALFQQYTTETCSDNDMQHAGRSSPRLTNLI